MYRNSQVDLIIVFQSIGSYLNLYHVTAIFSHLHGDTEDVDSVVITDMLKEPVYGDESASPSNPSTETENI